MCDVITHPIICMVSCLFWWVGVSVPASQPSHVVSCAWHSLYCMCWFKVLPAIIWCIQSPNCTCQFKVLPAITSCIICMTFPVLHVLIWGAVNHHLVHHMHATHMLWFMVQSIRRWCIMLHYAGDVDRQERVHLITTSCSWNCEATADDARCFTHLMQVASAYHMLVNSETTTFKEYDPTPCTTMLLM